MIACLHWDLREHLHELRKDDNNPKIRRDARFYVLTYFMMRANLRLRCWPSTKTICKATGYSQPMVVEARNWLVAHQAIVVVPFGKRVGDEEKLPIRQAVYQLTGILNLSGVIVPYIAMNPEMIESVMSELEAIGGEVVAVKTLVAKSLAAKPKDSTGIQDRPSKEFAPSGADTQPLHGNIIPFGESDGRTPTPISATPPTPEKKQGRVDPVFTAVTVNLFNLTTTALDKTTRGRMNKLSSIAREVFQLRYFPDKEYTPELAQKCANAIEAFCKYWPSVKQNMSLPTGNDTFATEFNLFLLSKSNGGANSNHVSNGAYKPVVVADTVTLTPEEIEERKRMRESA